MKGWGPRSSACPSKPGNPNLFGGISRDFAGMCPKSLRKKEFVFNFRSLKGQNVRGGARLGGAEVWKPLRGLRIRPLISAIWGRATEQDKKVGLWGGSSPRAPTLVPRTIVLGIGNGGGKQGHGNHPCAANRNPTWKFSINP